MNNRYEVLNNLFLWCCQLIFNYLNIVFEVTAHALRAVGVCVIILPIAGFLAFVAVGLHDGLIMILGLMAAGMTAIMAAVAAFAELEQATEEARAWRISVKN